SDVYLRHFSADATPDGPQSGSVTGSETGAKSSSSLSVDGAGNVLVTWRVAQTDGSWDIYARRLGPDGTALSGALRVTPTTEPNQPQGMATGMAAVGGTGDFLAAWSDYGGDGGSGGGL